MSPLHTAAAKDAFDVVHLLVSSEAVDLNARGPQGATPLHLASLTGSAPIVGLLLNAKADPSLVTDDGQTALALADDPEVQRLIEAAGGERDGGRN